MGCTTSINKLPGGSGGASETAPDGDPNRIIRFDMQMIKTVATPKNEINLMKLTEELLKALENLCIEMSDGDRGKYSQFEQQILNNNIKLESKVDEVTYLVGTASV